MTPRKATFIWPYVHAVSGLHGHGVDELRASVSLVASDYAARKQSKKNKATAMLQVVLEGGPRGMQLSRVASFSEALTGELLPLLEKACCQLVENKSHLLSRDGNTRGV